MKDVNGTIVIAEALKNTKTNQRIEKRPHLTIAAVNDESGSFFDRLPLFQPWAWELFAAVGTISFLLGIAIGVWADWSLAK